MLFEPTNRDIIKPTRQKSWGLAAVANFWLGGMSAAAYIVFAASVAFSQDQTRIPGDVLILLSGLMAVGFISVALHAGRPERARFAASRFRSSWMARETIAGFGFLLAAGLNLVIPNLLFAWLALLAAVLFLISQSLMPYRSLGVGGWGVADVPALFTAASFSSGVGLVLLSPPLPMEAAIYLARIIGILLTVLNALLWMRYVYRSQVSPPESLAFLRQKGNLLLVMGGGMLLPLLLLLIVLYRTPIEGSDFSLFRKLEMVAGVALMAGAFLQKYLIISKAGWYRALRLETDSKAESAQLTGK